MTIDHPYRRTFRQFSDGSYTEGGRAGYVEHPMYAQSPEHYVRAFLLLLKDLQELFDYVEPADENLQCYSYRIHALLLRACVEVEANCKAILIENGFTKSGNMTMGDYKKINFTHRLSSYYVKAPFWSGVKDFRSPFLYWDSNSSLPWYEAYNTTKHNRYTAFKEATLDHLIEAFSGLLILLSAQFGNNDFSPNSAFLVVEGSSDGLEDSIGDFFRVRYPNDWPKELCYEFNWQQLRNQTDPFQTFDYSKI
jgi:hypothetical protein